MRYKVEGTLAYIKSAPQIHRVRLFDIPVAHFAAATKEYRKTCGQTNPDEDAVTFYTCNHLMSVLTKNFTLNEDLPEWAKDFGKLYLKTLSEQGNRMLHYILSICTREMRHLHQASVKANFWPTIEKDFGSEFSKFLKSLCNLTETQAVVKYMDAPPTCSVGAYMSGLAWAFHNGKWTPGYGGKAWGAVADACVAFIEGKTSMETLVDTGFTLAHNNGPIFNKGMMYDTYSSALNFMTILDIQRSGQMPEFLLDNNSYGLKKPSAAISWAKTFAKEYPNEFRGWVDWVALEKLGAVGTYPKWKMQQEVDHPAPKKPEVVKVKKEVEGKVVTETMKVNGMWDVMPGVAVKILERVGK